MIITTYRIYNEIKYIILVKYLLYNINIEIYYSVYNIFLNYASRKKKVYCKYIPHINYYKLY